MNELIAMPDFFISYTSADEAWAEWIAWMLEDAGFKVILQKWDFRVGSNFVLEMQHAAAEAKRTIAVLSPEYLRDSRFGASEWAAAFSQDPDGLRRTLIPVRVRECSIDGLLKAIVHADLVGLDEEMAKRRLLESVSDNRRKPAEPPAFPGAKSTTASSQFPSVRERPTNRSYIPRIRGAVTDVERRRFSRSAFASIQQRFREALDQLSLKNPEVEFDLISVDATKFTAEVFVSGRSRARCKIWIGGMMGGGDDISYAEGTASLSANTLNGSLTIHEDDGDLFLQALMGFATGRDVDGVDPRRMTIDDAASYLWRRFVSGLEG